jgi:hypothetical protein
VITRAHLQSPHDARAFFEMACANEGRKDVLVAENFKAAARQISLG